MAATADHVPDELRVLAERFLNFSPVWFEHEMGNLCEDVGWDFFPEEAAEFVMRLIVEIESKPLPSQSRLRELESCCMMPVEDFAFSDSDR